MESYAERILQTVMEALIKKMLTSKNTVEYSQHTKKKNEKRFFEIRKKYYLRYESIMGELEIWVS